MDDVDADDAGILEATGRSFEEWDALSMDFVMKFMAFTIATMEREFTFREGATTAVYGDVMAGTMGRLICALSDAFLRMSPEEPEEAAAVLIASVREMVRTTVEFHTEGRDGHQVH